MTFLLLANIITVFFLIVSAGIMYVGVKNFGWNNLYFLTIAFGVLSIILLILSRI